MSENQVMVVSAVERRRSRRLIGLVVLLSVVWVTSPYVVRLLFGREAANCAAGVGICLWVMSAISMAKPKRSRLSPAALSPVYLSIAVAFVVCLTATVLYLWFYG
jgi:hypothetical protein